MKKVTALVLPLAAYVGLTIPAFAAVDVAVSPCTSGAGQGFDLLCNIGAGGIGGVVNAVITMMFIVAVIVALFFLIYGGIKWITSGGDKAGVEAARNMIVAALVGLVVVFLSYFIINLVLNFFGLGGLTSGTSLTVPSLHLNP